MFPCSICNIFTTVFEKKKIRGFSKDRHFPPNTCHDLCDINGDNIQIKPRSWLIRPLVPGLNVSTTVFEKKIATVSKDRQFPPITVYNLCNINGDNI